MIPGPADRWKAAALVGTVALILTALAFAYPAPWPVAFSLALSLLVLSVLPLISTIPAWLPLEFRWVTGDMGLLKLVGVNLLLLLYVIERPVFELGRILPLRARELGWGVATYLGFLVVAVPLALMTGFARPGAADRSPGYWVIWLLGVFWLTALPEEVLFRGVIQGLLARALRRPWLALALAALVFGLAHVDNTPDAPDWRYVILASVAGIAYGLAYLRTGNIAAPVLTHFLVDATWGGLFQGPT